MTIGTKGKPWTDPRETVQVLRALTRRYHGKGKTASDRTDPFEILIVTILSARTKDETTHIVADALFRRYQNAAELSRAANKDVERLLHPIGFYHAKTRYVIRTAQMLVEQFHGEVPRTLDELMQLPGVGRKTANIVRSYAFNEQVIAVDIHVHRISNRLGWVNTVKPADTEQALLHLVPHAYLMAVNDSFVKFGKDICRPRQPQCWRCPIRQQCRFTGKTIKPTGRMTKKMLA